MSSDFHVTTEVFGKTDVGRVRPHNEDTFVIADLTTDKPYTGSSTAQLAVGARGVLVAVSDGMGGAAAGEVASALVVESLRDYLDDECREADILASIKCAVEETNKEVWEAASQAGRKGMGATLTAIVIHRALAHIAQVGDSRAYLIRNDRIRRITKDQSYVEFLIDAGMITREEAEHSPYRNVILQAMGVRPQVEIGLGRLLMRRDDVFVVCSDGLWEKVNADEVLAIVKDAPGLEAACDRCIALANERGGEDNITIVIARVDGAGLDRARGGETVTGSLETL